MDQLHDHDLEKNKLRNFINSNQSVKNKRGNFGVDVQSTEVKGKKNQIAHLISICFQLELLE